MIEFIKGDIFLSGCQALVNPVNTVGVMGNGLAKQFKEKFPVNYKLYKKACCSSDLDVERLTTSSLFWTRDMHYSCGMSTPVTIINFPTKDHCKLGSEMMYIAVGLVSLKELIVERNLQSVAIPALGCGKGQLKWIDVKPVIIGALACMADVKIMVYEPQE